MNCCLVCSLKPQLLGFPQLLERQPFGEMPAFPGGAGRAAQDMWIPLLPAPAPSVRKGWRNSCSGGLPSQKNTKRVHSQGGNWGFWKLVGAKEAQLVVRRMNDEVRERENKGAYLHRTHRFAPLVHFLFSNRLQNWLSSHPEKGQANAWSKGQAPPQPRIPKCLLFAHFPQPAKTFLGLALHFLVNAL